VSQEGVQDWIRAGDLRRAAASLVVSHGSDVLATCIAMVRDRAVAEDLTQDVFSDAFRSLATFRGDSSPRTWLLSIARNRCVDYLRARKRDPWGGALDESSPDPDEHADEASFGSEWFADRSVVLRALDTLAEGERALIVLRFKNGLEYDELAQVFRLREGTVRMRVSRALARMRHVLERDAQALMETTLGAPAPSASLPRAPMSPAAMGPPAPAMRARAVLGGAPTEGAAPVSRSGHPLGFILAAWETAGPSETLVARLGVMIDGIERR
jgi:RNA polymerase sigma-70 factor (ECF subfamily)